jgi:hypothetical protein
MKYELNKVLICTIEWHNSKRFDSDIPEERKYEIFEYAIGRNAWLFG